MKLLKVVPFTLALMLSAILAPSSSAQTLQVLTAGSSAQFGPFAVAAYSLAQSGGVKAYHYTVKSGACPGTTCYAYINDTRNASIAQEPGNLFVVWSTNGVWAYLSVDSTVGVRAFSAVPRATLAMAALASLPVSTTTNYTFWADGTNDTAMTSTVYSALSAKAFTAANTDIRPEDALFATNNALNVLGYGTVADTRSGHSGQFLIGKAIASHFSSAIANPVSFAIAGGADPFSGTAGPAEITIPVGAAPIVFVANTLAGSTVAAANNITSANASTLFSGTNCSSTLVTGATGAINPVLRESLSGTMNTTEFSVFRYAPDSPAGISQETGINLANANTNPLALPCTAGGGTRYRGVGTGDVVNNVIATASTLGYAFFSYESVGQNSGGTKTFRYLKLNSVDGINATYTSGALPYCPVVSGQYSCPIAGGKSFVNLRNGSYHGWSIYRVITDSTHQTTTQTLVAKAQALVDSNIPDFVPFVPVCAAVTGGSNDPGLDMYREHFIFKTGVTNPLAVPDTVSIVANDGPIGSATVSCRTVKGTYPSLTLGGGTEAGGDVGGMLEGPFTANPPTPGPTESAPH
jgi:hypothetical protein